MKRVQPLAFLSILPGIVFFASSFSETRSAGETVINEMYQAWKGKWYQTIAFEQEAIFYTDKKVAKTEIWQELLSSPGNLNIRFNGFQTGNGAIYANDSAYRYQNGVLQSKRKETNFLQLLGFDVYFYAPEITVSKLKELGFDLNKSYVRTSSNGKVTVIGTSNEQDRTSSQFWVENKRNLVIRAIKNTGGTIRDVEFGKYQKIEKNWVATAMIFTNGTDTVFVEKYFNIRFPKQVDKQLFNPDNFSKAKW